MGKLIADNLRRQLIEMNTDQLGLELVGQCHNHWEVFVRVRKNNNVAAKLIYEPKWEKYAILTKNDFLFDDTACVLISDALRLLNDNPPEDEG